MKKIFQVGGIVLLFSLLAGTIFAATETQPRGSIRGAVYLDSDGDGICSNNDLPVSHVDILFTSTNSASVTLYSGSNGTYGLVAAPLGEWLVTAVPPANEWIVTSPNPLSVTLAESNNRLVTEVNFCVKQGIDAPDTVKPIATDFSANHAASTLLLSSKETAASTSAGTNSSNAAQPATIQFDPVEAADPVAVEASDWLGYLNQFREMAGLPPLQEMESLTQGSLLHSRYMVVNDKAVAHSQDRNNPLYDPAGHNAAVNGNIFATSQIQADHTWGINFWISAPFHLMGIIDPELEFVGFGRHNQAVGTFRMAAVLDVGTERGNTTSTVEYPIFFPGDGSTTHVVRRSLYEWPDPITPCPGYSIPTGSPVVLQLGDGSLTPNVTGHQLFRNGVPVDSCVYDETNYVNPDSYAQSAGRSILDLRDAVVMIPREPLEGGATYTVQITANGELHSWSFTARKP